MKKYKLIKQYPGSPALGTIVQGNGQQGWYTKGPGHPTYDWTQVVNYPKFWQEVVEKDYKILKERASVNIGSNKIEILSVKRLSDGEVFTVGDKFEANIGGTDVIRTVKAIHVRGDILTITQENGFLTNEKNGGIFCEIKKFKQPIFLTHDGKDIFEGDTVWYVNKQGFHKSWFIVSRNQSFYSDRVAYFLTKEGAEDYIKKNKVLFTTKDGVGIKHGDTYYYIDTDFSIDSSKANFQAVGMSTKSKYFSTRAAAENYVVQKSHSLSIEDFWEFVCWGGSNIAKSKRLERLVKERLNLK